MPVFTDCSILNTDLEAAMRTWVDALLLSATLLNNSIKLWRWQTPYGWQSTTCWNSFVPCDFPLACRHLLRSVICSIYSALRSLSRLRPALAYMLAWTCWSPVCVSNKEDPMHISCHAVLTFQLLLPGQTDLRLLDFLMYYSSIRSQITLKGNREDWHRSKKLLRLLLVL